MSIYNIAVKLSRHNMFNMLITIYMIFMRDTYLKHTGQIQRNCAVRLNAPIAKHMNALVISGGLLGQQLLD